MNRLPLCAAILCAGAVVGFADAALADCSGNLCDQERVDRIVLHDSTAILVGTTGDETGLNCVPIEGRYIAIPASHKQQERVFTLLLAAKLDNEDVWLRVANTPGSDCVLKYVVLE